MNKDDKAVIFGVIATMVFVLIFGFAMTFEEEYRFYKRGREDHTEMSFKSSSDEVPMTYHFNGKLMFVKEYQPRYGESWCSIAEPRGWSGKDLARLNKKDWLNDGLYYGGDPILVPYEWDMS